MESEKKNSSQVELLPKQIGDVFIIPEHVKKGIRQGKKDIKMATSSLWMSLKKDTNNI